VKAADRRLAMAGAGAAFVVAAYWVAVFGGLFPVDELVLGYRAWFMAFPLADAWIAVSGTWLLASALRGGRSMVVPAAALGSALLFLGLYAFAYGAGTGLLFQLTPDELLEIAIKVTCVSVGSALVAVAARRAAAPEVLPATDVERG
jgi:hypothetical protein